MRLCRLLCFHLCIVSEVSFPKNRMDPPFSFCDYIARNEFYLDAKIFYAIRDAGDAEELPDWNGIKSLTTAGGCSKRWN